MQQENLIDKEVAEKEFYKWLDNLGFIPEDFQEDGELFDQKGSRSKIIKAICDGHITIDDELKLTFELYNPIISDAGKDALSSITFKSDYQGWEQNNAMKGIDKSVAGSVMVGMASMLTGKGRAILGKMNSKDTKIMQSVTAFFLL
jgi:hypothetical protein